MQLPASGTRGPKKIVRRMMRMTSWWGNRMFRRGAEAQGRPLLELTTVGARSGKERHTILGWFPDDNDRAESWIVVAANGGSAWHPAWAHNLAKDPHRVTVDRGDGPVEVNAALLASPEREAAWKRVVALAPAYTSFMARTDRELPVFRLTRQT